MFGKHFLLIILLVAALVGPAIYFNAKWPNLQTVDNSSWSNGSFTGIPARDQSSIDLSPRGLAQQVSTIQVANPIGANTINPANSGFQSPPAASFSNNVVLPGNANGPDFNAVPLEFMPVTNLGEILRFDANPSWIRQRWERVSNVNSHGLTGLRVALVTGVNANDLFGSLTYYFDQNQVPQKITFRGWTGDPNGLINFVSKAYDFQKQPTSSAGLYVAKTWRKSTGALYLQHPEVSHAANPTQQLAVLLELNNPNGPFELSMDVASMIYNVSR